MASTFTFNGVTMSTYGMYVAEGSDIWMPAPVVQQAGAPGSGYRFGGSGYQVAPLVLPCYVLASDLSTLRTYRDAIARALDVTQGAKKLSVDAIPNRYWLGILNSAMPAPQRAGFNTRFDLTFALEGYAYDTTPVAPSGTTINANPFTFTISAPAGSAPATCVWYIRNTSGSTSTGAIRLNVSTQGEFIEWSGTFLTSYWLRIGSMDADGRYTYSLDMSTTGGSDPTVLTYTNAKTGVTANGGDWPRLKAAVSNSVTVTGLSAGTVQYSYTPRYIGG